MEIDFSFTTTRSGVQRVELCKKSSKIASNDYHDFGYDYFDNAGLDRGYGGYRYDGRYKTAAERMCQYYNLKRGDSVLEVGCAKGFILVELLNLGMNVSGIDISKYAVEHAHPDVKPYLLCGNANILKYEDNTFDLVFAKEVLPHVPEDELVNVVQECMRVAKKNVFFEIQVGQTRQELEHLLQWDLTHKVCRTPAWWNEFFVKIGYNGDVHYKPIMA